MKIRSNFSIEENLKQQLEQLSKETLIRMSPLVEEGIREIIKKYQREGYLQQ